MKIITSWVLLIVGFFLIGGPILYWTLWQKNILGIPPGVLEIVGSFSISLTCGMWHPEFTNLAIIVALGRVAAAIFDPYIWSFILKDNSNKKRWVLTSAVSNVLVLAIDIAAYTIGMRIQ